MTDQPNSAPAPGGLSLERVTQTLERARGVGPEFYAKAVEAARKDGYVVPGHEPAPNGTSQGPEPMPSLDPASKLPSRVGADQATRMGAALIKAGVDPEKVRAAVAQEGVALQQDPRSEDERDFDRVFARGTPQEYNISWRDRVPDGVSERDLPALNNDVRAVLSAMSFPTKIGGSVAEDGLQDGIAYGRMDDLGKAQWEMEQKALLGRAVGAANVEKAISNARVLLAAAKEQNPKAYERLTELNVFRSARVLAQLHLQVERSLNRVGLAETRGKR
jgi:hypothetical protein